MEISHTPLTRTGQAWPANPAQERATGRLNRSGNEPIRDTLSIPQFDRPDFKESEGIRPEMVQRGRELAADPDYPGSEVTGKVAEILLRDFGLVE